MTNVDGTQMHYDEGDEVGRRLTVAERREAGLVMAGVGVAQDAPGDVVRDVLGTLGITPESLTACPVRRTCPLEAGHPGDCPGVAA